MLAGASKPPVRHVSALTSLRFFAALGVVLFHYYPRSEDASGPVFNLMNHAYVGVSFFFVLSGFVLAYTTGTKDRYTRTEYLTFYARRIARVYPAFLLATLLHWPLFAWFQLATLPSPDDFLRIGGVSLLTFSLTQSYFPWSLGELNAPSWSVSVEMFLYAMFPWLLVRISGLRTNSRWFLLAACLCLCWIPCLLQLWLQSLAFIPWEWPLWISGPLPVLSTWISSFPLFHLAQFAVGVIAGVWTLERLKQPAPHKALTGLTVASVLVSLAVLLIPKGAVPLLDTALNHGALASCFAVTFSWLALCPKGSISQLLSGSLLVRLGDASYAMYILQLPIMAWTALSLRKMGVTDAPMALLVIGIICLIAASMACTVVENRIRPGLAVWLTRQLGGGISDKTGHTKIESPG